MDEFGYLSVLLSIIIGLAIAQLLIGWRGRMLARARVRPYWPTDLWSGVLLLISTQMWWAMFDLRNRHEWQFSYFAILLAQTIALYLLAGLVYPEFNEGAEVDLRQHYFAQRRHFFSLAIASTLISISRDLVLNHALPHPLNLGFHIFYIAIAVIALLTSYEAFHKAAVVVMTAVFVTYVIALFAQLPSG